MRDSHIDIVSTDLTDRVNVWMYEGPQHFPWGTIIVQIPWASTDFWSCCNIGNEVDIRIVRSTLILMSSRDKKGGEESDAFSPLFTFESHIVREYHSNGFNDTVSAENLGAQ